MIRQAIHQILRRMGFDLFRLRDIPFGVNWCDDIRFCRNSAEINAVLDIGAHVGQTAKSVLEAFPNAKVFSFEPVPSSFEQLQRNMQGNSRVVCMPMAVSDAVGSVAMSNRQGHTMNRILTAEEVAGTANSTVQVETITVDEFCKRQGIERIDLLKIDTEGHELGVLRGAREMLQKGVGFLLIECEFQPREGIAPLGPFQQILQTLDPLGYRIVSLYSGRIDQQGWVYGDVLFMHPALSPNQKRPTVSPYRRGISGDS